MAKKATVTLDGVSLAATSAIVWRFVTGVTPYTAVFSVHKSEWTGRLEKRAGKAVELVVEDSRNVKTTIRELYILHTVPSDSPHRVSFLVADRRWKWSYKLVARDYNITRKTGNRTAQKEQVPVETKLYFDQYDYLAYSLFQGQTKWTARQAIEDVLSIVEPLAKPVFDSFPVSADSHSRKGGDREFTLQNITLRDQGDVAIARVLSYIPGAELYINADGQLVLFDSTDLDGGEHILDGAQPTTWDGEAITKVERKQIRPNKVIVHYQREIEVAFEYSDNYAGTSVADPIRNAPFLENVLPTVDPSTSLEVYDPEPGGSQRVDVPPGTWVPVRQWLAAMDYAKPSGSLPWTFETIRWGWYLGLLADWLGARGDADDTEDGNVAARVAALHTHFRQTFRINRRYMERIRSLRAVRVALLDPVTGARAPSAVWGQCCMIPSDKGCLLMGNRRDPNRAKYFRNIDYLYPSISEGFELIDTAPSPALVTILDADLGIFRVEWKPSPYGDVGSIVPSILVGEDGHSMVPTRDLAQQDTQCVVPGAIIDSGSNAISLRPRMELKAILTIVPNAPNNPKQFHWIEVDTKEIAGLFHREFRIRDGEGPALEAWVPPGELTSRWGWKDDQKCYETIQAVLGLDSDDPDQAGIGGDLPGFVHVNEERHLQSHAISLAAELMMPFADAKQGTVASAVPRKFRLAGGVKSATIRVAAAPSAKVDAVHEFHGERRGISRWATLPESARRVILGTVPGKE